MTSTIPGTDVQYQHTISDSSSESENEHVQVLHKSAAAMSGQVAEVKLSVTAEQ